MFAGRVNADANERFERICQSKGVTPYELIQLYIDCFIRYMDEGCQLSDELKTIIERFDWECGGGYSLATNCRTDEQEVVGAIYFMRRKGHRGTRCVYVEPAFMALRTPDTSCNIQEMFDTFLQAADSVAYRQLKAIARDQDCNGVWEAMLSLINAYCIDDDGKELRRLFSDNRRSDFGRTMAEQPYRRVMHRDIEKVGAIDSSQLTLFSPDDFT